MSNPKNGAPAAAPANPGAEVPAGYMRNARGHLVPVETISELDMMRDALVQELVSDARGLSARIAGFKRNVFESVHAFAAESAAKYQAPIGGRKGNITLHSFDGSLKVVMATAENITFDERLQSAKALIDACIDEWASDSRPELKVLVQQAFDTDKEGKLNVGRILSLQRLEITDPRWQSAMKAVRESVQVVGTKQYVRFYERVGNSDEYRPISLDVAAI